MLNKTKLFSYFILLYKNNLKYLNIFFYIFIIYYNNKL